METECPNCGHVYQETRGIISWDDSRAIALWCACPRCGETYAEWFKPQRLGRTLDDCVATASCRFFYPVPGETEESMIAAGVPKPESVMMKGTR